MITNTGAIGTSIMIAIPTDRTCAGDKAVIHPLTPVTTRRPAALFKFKLNVRSCVLMRMPILPPAPPWSSPKAVVLAEECLSGPYSGGSGQSAKPQSARATNYFVATNL